MFRSFTITTVIAFLLAGTQTLAQQQITSPDGTTWNCPTEQTISVAYLPYCPSTTTNGLVLLGASAIGHYPNAPANFQSTANDFQLICGYGSSGTTSATVNCAYTAGAGNPLVQKSGNAATCRTPSSTVPQPSPGVNYRRRIAEELHSLTKRYNTNTQFTCPRTSSIANRYLTFDQISNGVRSNGNEYIYDCVFNYPSGSDSIRCSYAMDASRGPVIFASPNSQFCPRTLCTAIKTGSGNMRRDVFVEGTETLGQRQVKAARLRRGLDEGVQSKRGKFLGRFGDH